ncbi:MAG: efflux RND transporter permease subunit [Hormoscilla sp. GM7CHS1pb]|nr:efflux RND transporter permease subunit [Hormoscilla sp. GM7CHS1pb]
MKNTITSKITAYFINSQVTILLIAALLAFGFMAVLFTPKEENPQIVVPVADIYLSYPGAPVEVVEKTLTTPVEAKIREVTGVEHIYSASSNSGARITVQFFVGQNWEESLFKLQNQLFSYQDQLLPPGVTYIIKPISVDDVPIVTLTLTGEHYTDNQLRRVGERLLADLRSVPNTANLTITGGQPRTIVIDIDPDRLAGYRLSLLAIAGELERENVQLPAGDISLGKNRLFIQGGNLFQSLADVKNTIIGFGAENSPIYLEDAATVKDDFGDRTTISRINYRQDADITYSHPDPDLTPRGPFITQPAITLGITKKPGTNAVKVARDILKRVEELKTQLPPGVEIAVTRNDGVTASGAVKDLYRSLFLAIVIVVALLIPFLGWRSAAIVAFVIPLTLAGTLGVGWLAGQTINRITLFALILTLGTLVDDAIAITENIHRRFEQPGMNFAQKAQEAIAAVSELGSPVILSTITVILAFLPMGFVTGMMGPYMGPIPFNVPVAMVISTILALTVIPFLALRFLKVKPPQRSTTGTRVSQWYTLVMEPLLNSAFRRRFLLLFIASLLLASLTLPLTQVVKFRMLPKADKDTFLVQLDAPNGTSLAQTNRIVNSLEAILKEERQITNFETYVGTRAPVDFNNLLRGGTPSPTNGF